MSNYTPIMVSDIETFKLMYLKRNNDIYLPTFHITPPFGLLNDPNGLIEINGETHIFFQWHPQSVTHDLKYWYHLSTNDFMHFTDHKIGLRPYDYTNLKGCFSGSAYKFDDKTLITYTGNSIKDFNDFSLRKSTQKILEFDLDNNLINSEIHNLVDDSYTPHNRDPQIFNINSQKYLIFGAKDKQNTGCLAVYELDENLKPSKINTIYDNSFVSYMWECPNIIEIDNKILFLFSPQGVDSDNNYNFQSIYNVVYHLSDDFNGDFVNKSSIKELDKGFDFYAPQVYKDNNGDYVLIAWLGGGEISIPTQKNHWGHSLSIPRKIFIKNGILHQEPYYKLESLYKNDKIFNSHINLTTRSFMIQFEIIDDFKIKFGNEDKYFEFSRSSDLFKIERSKNDLQIENTTSKKANQTLRYFKSTHINQIITLFVDSSTIEIFINNNENTVSSVFYVEKLEKIINENNLTIKFSELSNIELYNENYEFGKLFL